MKDQKGHGSEAKGAHATGIETATNSQFTAAQLDTLKAGFNGIQTVDPDGESYKRLTGMLDKMSQDQLKYLSGAGIKFVSKLAGNRVQQPLNAWGQTPATAKAVRKQLRMDRINRRGRSYP